MSECQAAKSELGYGGNFYDVGESAGDPKGCFFWGNDVRNKPNQHDVGILPHTAYHRTPLSLTPQVYFNAHEIGQGKAGPTLICTTGWLPPAAVHPS